MKRPSPQAHTTRSRDAALLKLRRVNRWLIMGSVLLTAVLADVAANAFPGKKKGSTSSGTSSQHKKSPPVGVLAPPGQAPEGTSEGSSGGNPSGEGSAGQGSSSGESSTGEEQRAPETSSAPESSSEAPSSEGSSSESSGPVVSGGS